MVSIPLILPSAAFLRMSEGRYTGAISSGYFFHDALEDVDLFQRRHQRVSTGGLIAQIDEGGKALEHIVAFFQLLQVDVQIVLRKALGAPAFSA